MFKHGNNCGVVCLFFWQKDTIQLVLQQIMALIISWGQAATAAKADLQQSWAQRSVEQTELSDVGVQIEG